MTAFLSHRSPLGVALQLCRKAGKQTQAGLAAAAGVSITAVRTAEHGQGRFSTFRLIAAALGVELRGRALPAGPLGPALAAMRKRRRQSRRSVARALGVSRNTLAAAKGGSGLLAVLEAYGGAIGAGLHLAPVGGEKPFYMHAGNSSAHPSWETPPALAALLTQAVGGFDLDPCAASRDRRRARVKAMLLRTAEDDGLSMPWWGRVFVNPPYGRGLNAWVQKCAGEAGSGRARGGAAACPVRHEVVARSYRWPGACLHAARTAAVRGWR